MRIVIYESSSFGGCYDYCLYLLKEYKKHPAVKDIKLILPFGADASDRDVLRILLSDTVDLRIGALKKLYFLVRNFINPFILFFYLLFSRKSLVILNDFEQISAPVWVPFYKLLLRRHQFAIFLHDPDRDNYPPSKAFSTFCMKRMMGLMQYGLYHDYLPQKSYYQGVDCKYISVPHGVYESSTPDIVLKDEILSKSNGKKVFSIIGNIRHEKNYHLAIEALAHVEDAVLLIAGKAANSSVDTNEYKQLAKRSGVADRVIWVERFLSEEELAAVIDVSDVILLYYASTFTSQSGVLNLVAPFKKMLILSDAGSSVSVVAKRFGLGMMVKPDSLESLIEAFKSISEGAYAVETDWQRYLLYASWDNHVETVLSNVRPSIVEKVNVLQNS